MLSTQSSEKKINSKVSRKKPFENCLICKLNYLRYERRDVVKWFLHSKKPRHEKVELASLITGITFDEELLECLENPSFFKFFFQE